MTEVKEVNPKAILLLERGVKALHKKNYKQATNAFSSLLEKFPSERGLRDRALAFLSTCERMTAAKPKPPTEGSKILHLAAYHLNRHELEEARALLDAAKRKTSIKPETTYTFALYYALCGEEEQALDCLADAIELDQAAKFAARTENDLTSLHELPRFQELVS